MSSYFIRIGSRPRRDLDRGYSYSMGCFGDESQAHAGLSGYEVDAASIAEAVEALHDRMGVTGRFTAEVGSRLARAGRDAVMFLSVYEGTRRGAGPDGEDLFRPARLVASIKTRDLASVEDAAAFVARALAG